MCNIGVDLHVDIKWSLSLIFFTCNPRCISYVDYWCTFSGVFHVNCFMWANGIPAHVISKDIMWRMPPFFVSHVYTCIFHMDYSCTYPRVYLVDIMWWLSLDSLLMCIPCGVFYVDHWCRSTYPLYYTWSHDSKPFRYGPLCASWGPSDNITLHASRWPNSKPTLGQHLMFAGWWLYYLFCRITKNDSELYYQGICLDASI